MYTLQLCASKKGIICRNCTNQTLEAFLLHLHIPSISRYLRSRRTPLSTTSIKLRCISVLYVYLQLTWNYGSVKESNNLSFHTQFDTPQPYSNIIYIHRHMLYIVLSPSLLLLIITHQYMSYTATTTLYSVMWPL